MSNTNTTTPTPRPVVAMNSYAPKHGQRPQNLGDVYMSTQYPLGETGLGWLSAIITHNDAVTVWRPEHPTSDRTAGLALVIIGPGERVHAVSVDSINATTGPVAIVDRGDWDGSGWVSVDPAGLLSAVAIASAN